MTDAELEKLKKELMDDFKEVRDRQYIMKREHITGHHTRCALASEKASVVTALMAVERECRERKQQQPKTINKGPL